MKASWRPATIAVPKGSAPGNSRAATFGQGTNLFITPRDFDCVYSGSADRLSFGRGTRLLVKHNITPSPSVYRLTSEDDRNLEMCLITDYSPDKLDLSSVDRKTETVVEVATSENKYEASYLSTYWAKKDEMQCGAKHEGFAVLEDDPEAGASTVCITGMLPHFKTDENLNMLTFSQMGLKIILMKAIIFNVLMTMLMRKKNE
ncbi:M1-specific T cell receptor alpha chain-like [Centrocercus urophasianus]|uniref:M1-specific T cell receptor alpha chain-like n=1 Tax=Centrocercus urophasianus TaxID=9002 RepID=UPI001C64BC52|nr:M1-specific T cell receptor alpha chain-like [Centrocercus urophasianus]